MLHIWFIQPYLAWLNLPKDDRHYGHKQKFLRESLRPTQHSNLIPLEVPNILHLHHHILNTSQSIFPLMCGFNVVFKSFWKMDINDSLFPSMMPNSPSHLQAHFEEFTKFSLSCHYLYDPGSWPPMYGIPFAQVFCQVHFTCFPSPLCQIVKSMFQFPHLAIFA